MGYRSNVAAVVQVNYDCPNPADVFNRFRAEALLAAPAFDAHWKDYSEWDEESHRMTFFVEDVKWYDGYEHVDAFDTVWHIAQNNPDLSGGFVRVGEEPSDAAEDYFGDDAPYDSVYISRDVHIDLYTPPQPDPQMRLPLETTTGAATGGLCLA